MVAEKYIAPGIYRQDVFPAPEAELRTGVPAFLGFSYGRLLFSTKSEFAKDLNDGKISEDLRQDFRANQIFLSPTNSFEKQDSSWLITDKANHKTYFIKKDEMNNELNVHRLPPANVPQMLTLWSQFVENFGKALPNGYLAHAVRGFFENGGMLCCVVPLEPAGPGQESLDSLNKGLKTIETLQTIDLVCAPDIMRPRSDSKYELPSKSLNDVERMQKAVFNHCDQLGDRFAILDSRPCDSPEDVLDQRQGLKGINGAIYYPWVRVPGGPALTGGFVPPCGHIAGVYARSDQRVGVYKAPANEILEGVTDVEFDLADSDQGRLNPKGVNCLRAFPGRGIRVWGARTLNSDAVNDSSNWQYINVRRLFLTAGRWIERNLASEVFEPNEPWLWARITRELTDYFNDLYRQGALKGRTAGEAFYVKCDAETNPSEVREAGEVVTEIGLAPTRPSEFVTVRIIHGSSGVTISGPSRPAE